MKIAVIGAGTMGSAAAYHLARRGYEVVAFEQFRVVHEKGSHSGTTRIIRHAYHESPYYVPLVLRADHLWLELEQESGTQLLIRTGAIVLGPEGCDAVQGAILACERHSLPYTQMNSAQIQQRWPQFRIPENWEGCFDPMAEFLLVEPCIKSHLKFAQLHGTKVIENEAVTEINAEGERFVIRTDFNDYTADKLVVTAGAWSARLLADLHLPLVVKRRTLSWLQPRNPAQFQIKSFPVFLADVPDGLLYGFPIFGNNAVKIANHHSKGPGVNPDLADRNYSKEDAADVLRFASAYLHDLSNEIVDGKVCLYNLTPDEDFIVDLHPRNPNIVIATGFSGHGFKFAPVIGEIIADLCLNGKTAHAIDRFQIARFKEYHDTGAGS